MSPDPLWGLGTETKILQATNRVCVSSTMFYCTERCIVLIFIVYYKCSSNVARINLPIFPDLFLYKNELGNWARR